MGAPGPRTYLLVAQWLEENLEKLNVKSAVQVERNERELGGGGGLLSLSWSKDIVERAWMEGQG